MEISRRTAHAHCSFDTGRTRSKRDELKYKILMGDGRGKIRRRNHEIGGGRKTKTGTYINIIITAHAQTAAAVDLTHTAMDFTRDGGTTDPRTR